MEYEIKHNVEEERFEAFSDHKILGVINYVKENDIITVTHTGVKPQYEGQGIAAELTKVALDYIIENELKLMPLCSYTKNYIIRHPEHQCLLPKGLE